MSGPQTKTAVSPVVNATGVFYTLVPVGSLRSCLSPTPEV